MASITSLDAVGEGEGLSDPLGDSDFMPYTVITGTSDFQLAKNNGYVLNLSSSTASVNLKMPATSGLIPGDRINIYPSVGKAKIQYNTADAGFLYKPNSLTSSVVVSEIPIDNENIHFGFIYTGSTLGWMPVDKYNLTYTLYTAPPSTVAYTASQSTTFGGAPAATYSSMTDNNPDTGTTTANGFPSWIQATFPYSVTVTGVTVSGGNEPSVGSLAAEINNANIQYSLDGSTGWTTVATVTGVNNNTGFFTFNFTGVDARYWRLSRSGFLSTGTFKFLP